MLKAQGASNPPKTAGPQVGLALAGGGPLGLVYEVGALRALDEALEGLNFNRIHTYVGVSAGAVIASALANDISTKEMIRILVRDDSDEAVLNPQTFLRPNFGEYFSRTLLVPGLIVEAFQRFLANPCDLSLAQSLTVLSRALPTGIFDNHAIHEFLSALYSNGGRTNDFRELGKRLYLIAVDLDTAASVRFGSEGRDHIPISKAVQASTALPGMYPPVEIEGHSYVDGALQRTLHASVALEAGADLVLCINPIVPYDARLAGHGSPPEYGSLVRGGAPSVMSQTFKALIHSRMKVGMAKYDTQYEDADVILFEPDRDDVKMFFANVFSFANRRRVCEHAYQTTRRDLLARREQLGPIFARHGVRMRTDILADTNRTFSTSLEMGAARHGRRRAAVTAGLSRALDNLEQMLEGADLPGDLIHY